MYFSQFASQYGRPISAKVFRKMLQGSAQAMRSFVKDKRSWLIGQLFQSGLPPFFYGQKTLEDETLARQAAGHQRGHESRGTGQGLHFQPKAQRLPDD